MRLAVAIVVIGLLTTSCGGGGSGAPASQVLNPVPATVQSPGSHWFVLDNNSDPVHLYVSETGKVRSVFHVTAVTDGPTFGAGSVDITGTDGVHGELQARGIQPAGGQSPVDLSCTLSGTVRELSTLMLNIVCSDSADIVYDENFTMTPQPGYGAGSSLNDIAGNYTLPSGPSTNMLNIIADGTLFGMYHNGANCTVNGIVSIIDADYSFLGVEWTMANCTDPIGIYEGAVVSGFAMESPSPSDPSGSYYFLLTGMNAMGFYSISVTFEPT
jgi:hypothetical protein